MNYDDLKRKELMQLAKDRGVKFSATISNVDLRVLLMNSDQGYIITDEKDPELNVAAQIALETATVPAKAQKKQEEREEDQQPIAHAGTGAGYLYPQKSVLSTDGTGGAAHLNLERAYEIPEFFQTNDPLKRASGDESLSDAALAAKTPEELRRAKRVVQRRENPSGRSALG